MLELKMLKFGTISICGRLPKQNVGSEDVITSGLIPITFLYEYLRRYSRCGTFFSGLCIQNTTTLEIYSFKFHFKSSFFTFTLLKINFEVKT